MMPLLTLVTISIAITIGNTDPLIADYFYKIQGEAWVWKDSWITEAFFHKGGRALSILLALILLMIVGISWVNRSLLPHKKPLLYLFLATVFGSLFVSVFKSLLAVSCPWEFDRYGGTLIYSTVFEQLFLRNGEGCFPAGQASAGYAWISLYFFGLNYRSRWRWLGLAVPLLAGLVLGFAQQIRGAHFISHDVWTLAICWFTSLGLYIFVFNPHSTKKLT